MTGPGQHESDGSSEQHTTKPDKEQSHQPSLLAQLRGEEQRKAARKLKRERQKAKTEFRAWRRKLCQIIQTESELAFKADGSYNFVLPPKLTQLVYKVMVRDHIRMKNCSKDEAVNAVRQEFVDSVKESEKAEASGPG